ncbi:hypothetical protein [Sphingobacterium rhinopitheci]|uniref:hypothetical protein n=1 Tax=Sphingobacterium rhinopitheci TaxID=2781960 RepID=UPI001F51E584|nr:hypothetical protein [Sphingobacterium rhinopitheci]MCI0922012.1 hypothetical protein [Sphingobacterium rhinopitheci]
MSEITYTAIPFKLHLDHIIRLTNQVGILQHARFSFPNYHHGYCLDDNARALQLTAIARAIYNTSEYDHLIDTYLSYIMYIQNNDGTFKNFLSYENEFLDEIGSDDSFGRTIMALGITMEMDQRVHISRIITDIIDKSYDRLTQTLSIRTAAYIICGLHALHYSRKYSKDIRLKIKTLADFIISQYERNATNEWHWFEEYITYDNALIPYALFLSNEIIKDHRYEEVGILATIFLDSILFKGEYLALIGNNGWYSKNQPISTIGQQPIEIPSMILLYKKINLRYPQIKLKGTSQKCYEWLFGKNNIKQSLYDKETKGCSDGIEKNTINYNQGAESTISLWQAYLFFNH